VDPVAPIQTLPSEEELLAVARDKARKAAAEAQERARQLRERNQRTIAAVKIQAWFTREIQCRNQRREIRYMVSHTPNIILFNMKSVKLLLGSFSILFYILLVNFIIILYFSGGKTLF
jgi:hypothetical protein